MATWSRCSKLVVCPIAERRALGGPATAEIHGFPFGDGKLYRADACSLLGAIAERLALRHAARAPVMVAGLKFDCIGALLCAYGFGHDAPFIVVAGISFCTVRTGCGTCRAPPLQGGLHAIQICLRQGGECLADIIQMC